MCGSMADIQSPTAEIRRGKKERRKKSQGKNTMVCPILHRATIKMNLSTVKWAQWDKTQSRELLILFICVCSSLCTIVAHNTAQNRPANFPSCPPDKHYCSGDVYLRERGSGQTRQRSDDIGRTVLWQYICDQNSGKTHLIFFYIFAQTKLL